MLPGKAMSGVATRDDVFGPVTGVAIKDATIGQMFGVPISDASTSGQMPGVAKERMRHE
jgi:hypothetical protein